MDFSHVTIVYRERHFICNLPPLTALFTVYGRRFQFHRRYRLWRKWTSWAKKQLDWWCSPSFAANTTMPTVDATAPYTAHGQNAIRVKRPLPGWMWSSLWQGSIGRQSFPSDLSDYYYEHPRTS